MVFISVYYQKEEEEQETELVFSHRCHVLSGNLQATLGFGTATKKSVLQCNVGNKSPVYLCSLFPEKTECLQLNLEYEEADEVIFSVIGPRSIHLSGYFLGSCRHTNVNDDNSYPLICWQGG